VVSLPVDAASGTALPMCRRSPEMTSGVGRG
jgi:hypothetical protein